MNTNKLFLPLLFLSLLLCIFSTPTFAADKQSAQTTMQEARMLLQQSKALGFEWNTVTPLLSQARDALQSNDFDNAKKYALQAVQQAKLSIQQAKNEETNWQLNLPK